MIKTRLNKEGERDNKENIARSTILQTYPHSQNEVELAYKISQTLPAGDLRMIVILNKLHDMYSQQLADYKKSLNKLQDFHALQPRVKRLQSQLISYVNYDYIYSEVEKELQTIEPAYHAQKKLIEDTSYSLLQQIHPELKTLWVIRHHIDLLNEKHSEKQSEIYISKLINALPMQLEKIHFTDVVRKAITNNKDLLPPKERRQQSFISYWFKKAALLSNSIELTIDTNKTTNKSQYTYSLLKV